MSQSRRVFLQATTGAVVALPAAASTGDAASARVAAASSWLQLLRSPDRVFAITAEDRFALETSAGGAWAARTVRVETLLGHERLAVRVASEAPLRRLLLRWSVRVPENAACSATTGSAATATSSGAAWSPSDRCRGTS